MFPNFVEDCNLLLPDGSSDRFSEMYGALREQDTAIMIYILHIEYIMSLIGTQCRLTLMPARELSANGSAETTATITLLI